MGEQEQEQAPAEGAFEAPAPADETPQAQDSLNFPKNHLKSILGSGGSTISEIRKNGADVWIKPLDDHIEVYMAGSGEEVEAAKKHVLSVARAVEDDGWKRKRDDWEDWGSGGDWGDSGRRDWGGKGGKRNRHNNNNNNNQEGRENEVMELELTAFGCIVGPGGAKIKEVRQTSGAHVSIDKLSDHVEVKIVGSAEQIAIAKNMVNELVAGGGKGKGEEKGSQRNSWSGSDSRSEMLQFEASVTGNIIGTGGKRINDVRKQSGADVAVKKVGENCEVTISGTSDQVEMAKSMVNMFVQAARQGVSPSVLDGQQM